MDNFLLTSIVGHTELAQRNLNDPESLRKCPAGLAKAADRAKTLVPQILTFSRKTRLQKCPLQLVKIVGEATKMLRSSIPATIVIEEDFNSSATILADPTQMHQVVMNLCTNSYHAMRKTGGILTVSARYRNTKR